MFTLHIGEKTVRKLALLRNPIVNPSDEQSVWLGLARLEAADRAEAAEANAGAPYIPTRLRP